jgi:hypothetical protein
MALTGNDPSPADPADPSGPTADQLQQEPDRQAMPVDA